MARDRCVSSPVVVTVMGLVKCVPSVRKVVDILNLSQSLSTSQERTDKGKKNKTYGVRILLRESSYWLAEPIQPKANLDEHELDPNEDITGDGNVVIGGLVFEGDLPVRKERFPFLAARVAASR